MPLAKRNFQVDQGSIRQIAVLWTDVDDEVVDLTNFILRMQIKNKVADDATVTYLDTDETKINLANLRDKGIFIITFLATDSGSWDFRRAFYDLEMTPVNLIEIGGTGSNATYTSYDVDVFEVKGITVGPAEDSGSWTGTVGTHVTFSNFQKTAKNQAYVCVYSISIPQSENAGFIVYEGSVSAENQVGTVEAEGSLTWIQDKFKMRVAGPGDWTTGDQITFTVGGTNSELAKITSIGGAAFVDAVVGQLVRLRHPETTTNNLNWNHITAKVNALSGSGTIMHLDIALGGSDVSADTDLLIDLVVFEFTAQVIRLLGGKIRLSKEVTRAADVQPDPPLAFGTKIKAYTTALNAFARDPDVKVRLDNRQGFLYFVPFGVDKTIEDFQAVN